MFVPAPRQFSLSEETKAEIRGKERPRLFEVASKEFVFKRWV